MFSLGLGRNATVGRMLIASAISSATTTLMKITASVLPTSKTGLRRNAVSSPMTVRGVGVVVRHCAVGDVGPALVGIGNGLGNAPVFGQ